MIETPGELIETPPVGEADDPRGALLADVLAHIRLSGALFLRGHYSAPWSLHSPGNCDLIDLLSPEAERLLVFSYRAQGSRRRDRARRERGARGG